MAKIILIFMLSISVCFGADEIHFTIISPTAVTFNWRGSESQIDYGTVSGTLTSNAAASTPSPTPISSAGPWKEAPITGLTANTTYYYKIGTGTEYSFKTPPVNGTADFNIYAQGNIGNTLRWPKMFDVQNIIATDTDIAFVWMLGDLSQRSPAGPLVTNAHFDDVMIWSTKFAYMPVWGDMDWPSYAFENFANYKGRFAVPNSKTSPGSPLAGGEDWYWFDYGNTRFITLPDIWQGAIQDWLTNVDSIMSAAQTDSNIKHIVTASHRPAYSSGHYLSSVYIKNAIDSLGDLYNKYQLHLNAHSGNYERSAAQHGVTHVTVGTGGADLLQDGVGLWHTVSQPAWSAYRAMHLGVLKLNFNDTGITGTFRCGPSGGGTNDVTCATGTTLDTFTIGAASPGPVLSAISATNVTQTAADINWACDAPCTGRYEYGLTTGYGSGNGSGETSFLYSSHIQHLAGLTAGTLYHYRVRSTNQAGVETISADNNFTTAPPTPVGPTITAISASDILTTSAKLNWTCDVPCTGYYEYGLTNSYGSTNSPGETSYTYSAHSQNITGLTAGTQYHYRVRSTNAALVETISGDNLFNTATASGYHAPPPTSAFTVNVRDTGALGNGTANDTAAIQTAINQVGGTGGTVLVPAGTYMINALTSLNLLSNMTLRLETGANLKAITNSAEGYSIVKINGKTNVNVVGGTIEGERLTHTGQSCSPVAGFCGTSSVPGDPNGMLGQWGMGISIVSSSNVYVEAVTAKNCWGDGFFAGDGLSTNVNFYSVIADNNRRQGISLVYVTGSVVRDSILKNTNGVPPQAGIDVEPDTNFAVNNVQILNNYMFNNKGAGVLLFNGTGPINTVTVTGNRIDGNTGHYGISVNANSETVTGNYVGTDYKGIEVNGSNNTITGNFVAAPNPPIVVYSGTGNTVTPNTTLVGSYPNGYPGAPTIPQ